MKKLLLILSIFVVTFSSAFAAELNPFAYGLQIESTDAENFKITLQYTLNAPATSVKIYVKDAEGNSYLLKNCGARTKGLHSEEIDLMDAMENKNIPAGEELSWSVDVACASRGTQTKAVTCGRKIDFRSPFSIDIDNNPNSPYFGRIVTTQANNNETRGIRAYNPDFTQIGGNYIGSIVTFPSGNWFTYTHVTPFRIRVLQDGTGKIFVSSADVGQETYMWQVNPADLNDWSVFLTSAEMITLTGHPNNDDSMANHNFDFRKKSNGEWELLLLSSSINDKNKELSSGYSHCGIYTLNADLSKKSYTEYITNKQGAPHAVVDDEFIASVVSGNAQFDPNGNILYSSFQLSHDTEGSALIHHQVQKNTFSNGYNTFERLKRQNTATGGIRYSGDFSKLAVANGNQAKEVSICSVSHTQGYMTISSLESVDMISATHSTSAYIIDFAWDYASNLYACVRNSDQTALRGVWVMALNLDGEAISTPAREEYNFSIPCDPDQQYTVTCQATEGGKIVSGGGTQYACTQMTVKAEPNDNNYRFEKWTDQTGKTVSTNAEYTFYVYKDMQLTAHFIGAVFNVTWWNLFQGGEDIAKDNSNYPRTNERLWRLLQVTYNKSVTTRSNAADHTNSNTTTRTIVNKKQLNVSGFLPGTDGTVNFFKNNNLFKWLGDYLIAHSENGLGTTTNKSAWIYYPYMFINRTDTAINWANNFGDVSNYVFNGTNCAGTNHNNRVWDSFIEYGQSKHWRPYWTEKVCGLAPTYHYNLDMPITWNQTTSCPSGTIATVTPSDWYKWNTGGVNQLLAWREGSTSGRIVHHVDKPDMKLYATYVDKHIDEEQNNNDVIQLMQNPGYQGTPHELTVSRKLQAGMYNTICFPFTVYINDQTDNDVQHSGLAEKHPLKGATVYELTGMTNDLYNDSGEPVARLNFRQVNKLEAGKPYLIKLRDGLGDVTDPPLYPLYFTGIVYNDLTYTPGETATQDGVTFHAVINPTEIPASSVILVANNRLAEDPDGGEMLGLRGYFTFDDTDMQTLAKQGRVYLSFSAPTTTSVPLAPEAEQPKKIKAQKIMRNGQIYILRGDEVYTITGNRVK